MQQPRGYACCIQTFQTEIAKLQQLLKTHHTVKKAGNRIVGMWV